MSKLLPIASVLLIVLFVFFQNSLPEPGPRRPSPGEAPLMKEWDFEKSSPGSFEELAEGLPDFPISYHFDLSEPCSGICKGTAFAIEPAGTWLTAGHVVDHCDRIYLKSDQLLPVRRVLLHPSADVAVISTAPLAPTLGVDPEGLAGPAGRFFISAFQAASRARSTAVCWGGRMPAGGA